ncbi:MAG: nicotinate (nicotinamide) nucleotide adenylyltransferase [Parachlamydiales bacterium]|nr:nicotinate (nicotinamide) nucleotide adenylyltransferase [Parachlamydiales bacterium]
MKKKMIGLYGGTFDPPHFGHINLAIELQEKAKLEEVWVFPAYQAPHKKKNMVKTEPYHRMEMAKLAFGEIPNFSLLDWEMTRQGVSYTIDTLKDLHKKYGDTHLFRLMIAQDSFPSFFTWKDYEQIVVLAPPLIGCRLGVGELESMGALQQYCMMTHTMEISSTQIRERLKNNLYVGHLLPRKVLDYIHLHHLY